METHILLKATYHILSQVYALTTVLVVSSTSGFTQQEFNQFMQEHDKFYNSVEEYVKRYELYIFFVGRIWIEL